MGTLNLELAQELLIKLYKREIDNSEYFRTESKFSAYIQEFCEVAGIEEAELTEDQLGECALNFIKYDGGEYLLN